MPKQFKQSRPARTMDKPSTRPPSKQYQIAKRIRSSKAWQQVRGDVLRKFHSLCVNCNALANEVHHIKPVHLYPDDALDPDNCAPLCVTCHSWYDTRTTRGENTEVQLRPKMTALIDELRGTHDG